MTHTVVLAGFGPHVRFKTSADARAKVQVITSHDVKTVPLVKNTELNFVSAAA